MRIAVLIPDRGDRPRLLANCIRMMKAQTLQPHTILVINEPPKSDKPDITYRYRVGYEVISDVDLIAFIENDDWYHPEYLEYMATEWEKRGRPDMIGTNYTIYYHLKKRAYFTMQHDRRASAMNTLIKPDLEFKWCPDHEPYTDLHLWKTLKDTIKGVPFKPDRVISIGMKHGEGLCGGRSHIDRLHRYEAPDNGFLKRTLDKDSYNFYWNYFETV